MDMGKLVPINCVEILPGDSIQNQNSAVIRVTPQQKPVMHPVTVEVKSFFCPTRILDPDFPEMMTGAQTEDFETLTDDHAASTLLDYLGVPPGSGNNTVLSYPVQAVNAIWNEYFRDKDIQSERTSTDESLPSVNWEKDNFTTARPWVTRNTISLPIGTTAPVTHDATDTSDLAAYSTVHSAYHKLNTAGSNLVASSTAYSTYPLYADLSSVTGVDLVDFRESLALMRYEEARAKYGEDYVSYLRYLGIKPSDGRLNVPEYLGGGRQTISFSEVLQTSNDGTNGDVGDLYGHGIAGLKSNRFRKFFEEHGYMITFMYVRPKSIYCNSIDRMWSRTTKEDFFIKELETIGADEIYNREIYSEDSNPGDVFGYGERYYSYRRTPSRVSAEFRNSTSYDWHFGRIFSSDVALNDSFLTCSPSKRVFSEQTNHSLWVLCNNSVQARRRVSNKPVSRTF